MAEAMQSRVENVFLPRFLLTNSSSRSNFTDYEWYENWTQSSAVVESRAHMAEWPPSGKVENTFFTFFYFFYKKVLKSFKKL